VLQKNKGKRKERFIAFWVFLFLPNTLAHSLTHICSPFKRNIPLYFLHHLTKQNRTFFCPQVSIPQEICLNEFLSELSGSCKRSLATFSRFTFLIDFQ
jgi:hypothetical protein